MARGIKDTTAGETRNGYDIEKLGDLFKDVDVVEAKLEKLRGEYMAACKKEREKIANIYEHAARVDNIPTKVAKVMHENRCLDRKKEVNKARLDLEERADFSQMEDMIKQLGGLATLPLGEAALKGAQAKPAGKAGKAPPSKKSGNVVPMRKDGEGEGKDVRPRFMQQNPAGEPPASVSGEEAGKRLAEGIKPISEKTAKKVAAKKAAKGANDATKH